jgi:hypothetical protein
VERVIKELGYGAVVQHNYINITNFSPCSSDSEGTSAYKRLRRELGAERQTEQHER